MNRSNPARLLSLIARRHLGIGTLKTRHSDSLDFHDVSVWGVQAALQATFAAGQKSSTARCPSPTNGLPTPFDGYEIHGVCEFGRGRSRYCEQVPDEEAQFWSLYGHIAGQGLECVVDFQSREFAEEIYARIMGVADVSR